jgi:hypothetical protein
MKQEVLLNGPILSIKLNKIEREEYFKICDTIWACIPVDVNWARSTNLYQNELKKIYGK